ncbi:MAG TPA: pyridoxamine 5'-phosphate oxidase family protein [Thermoleophilaceae bacterium]
MPSRRDQIRMSDDELHAFLDEQMIVSCATIGPSGRPHLVPLWYSPDGVELSGWTYAKSQKTKNLERDPRATLQVEDGVQYQELRGAMLECDVEIEREPELVARYGMALFRRYGGTAELPPEVERMVENQASKRVGLRFKPTRIVTWDHRKLGGMY